MIDFVFFVGFLLTGLLLMVWGFRHLGKMTTELQRDRNSHLCDTYEHLQAANARLKEQYEHERDARVKLLNSLATSGIPVEFDENGDLTVVRLDIADAVQDLELMVRDLTKEPTPKSRIS